MRRFHRWLVTVWFALPLSVGFGQGLPPGFEVPPKDPSLANLPVRRVSGRSKLLYSNDQSRRNMIETFRRSTIAREKILFAECDFLIRRILIGDGKLLEPTYQTGKLKEDYVSGDFQIESIKFRSRKSKKFDAIGKRDHAHTEEAKAIMKERELEWEDEKENLQTFVTERLKKKDYGPDEIELEPIGDFFHRDEQLPENGGVFLSTSEMSLVGKMGSKTVTIDAPGMSMPSWTTYLDPRSIGFANQVEFKRGSTFDEVLARLNSGIPFSVEDFDQKPFVTIAFAIGMKRILFDVDKGYMPTYAVNFKGGERSKHKAILVFVNEVHLQSWVNAVKVKGHWVPKRARILTPNELIDIEIKWANVNQGMPESGFGIGTMQLPPNTEVIDMRTIPPSKITLHEGSNWKFAQPNPK